MSAHPPVCFCCLLLLLLRSSLAWRWIISRDCSSSHCCRPTPSRARRLPFRRCCRLPRPPRQLANGPRRRHNSPCCCTGDRSNGPSSTDQQSRAAAEQVAPAALPRCRHRSSRFVSPRRSTRRRRLSAFARASSIASSWSSSVPPRRLVCPCRRSASDACRRWRRTPAQPSTTRTSGWRSTYAPAEKRQQAADRLHRPRPLATESHRSSHRWTQPHR